MIELARRHMAGGTPEHAALSSALPLLIGAQLKGQPRRTYSSDLRIRVEATGLATYADASVVCDPARRDPASPTHVVNPRVIFEVLSPGTEAYDRGEKREHCQQIQTLREYILVAQDRRRVEVWRRPDESTVWSHSVHGADDVIGIASIGCSLDVNELHATAGVAVS